MSFSVLIGASAPAVTVAAGAASEGVTIRGMTETTPPSDYISACWRRASRC